jgi:hypothetical protein
MKGERGRPDPPVPGTVTRPEPADRLNDGEAAGYGRGNS